MRQVRVTWYLMIMLTPARNKPGKILYLCGADVVNLFKSWSGVQSEDISRYPMQATDMLKPLEYILFLLLSPLAK